MHNGAAHEARPCVSANSIPLGLGVHCLLTVANVKCAESLQVLTNTSNLTISGLALREAAYLLDNDGFVQAQAGCIVKTPSGAAPNSGGSQTLGFDGWTCMPGSIDVRRGRNVVFDNCSFTQIGAAGISFTKGSQNNRVSRSLFEDISGTSISIGAINTCVNGNH
jgi:hypothetical protein